jgi:hypothetical protein
MKVIPERRSRNIFVIYDHEYVPFVVITIQLFYFMAYYQVCRKNSTTVATSGTETTYPSGAPEVAQIF